MPRPLPPPAPEEDDELLKAISARLHPGVPPGVLPDVADPEPELPPTPQHPDPVVSTPPSGIHNTPSRRPKRNRALAERLKSSSPLKPSPIRLGKSANGALPFSLPAKNAQAETAAVTEPAPPPAESRGLKPADPDAEKKRLRDSLLAEISRLERDLDIASRENERIRQARLSRREPSPPANGDEILDLLARHVLPPGTSAPKPDPIEDLVASALNPIAFLPFSKPSPSGPPTLQRIQAPRRTQAGEDGGGGEELPPPVSHHPLPMTAAEALPYLRVFTPLTFTAHVSPLPRAESGSGGDGTADAPLLQQHSITASSASPRGLFAARIEMTVNTKTMAVASLAVPRLDPAAEAELRPFINKVVGAGENENGGGGGSSGLYNNVSVLTWAMGEWLRVAVQRAKAWIVLEREVGGSKEAFGEMVRRMRAGQVAGQRNPRRRMRRRRRRRWVERGGEEAEAEAEAAEEEEEGEDEEADQDGGSEGEDGEGESVDGTTMEKYGTADLLPFMGRTCIDLEVPVLEGRGRGEKSMLRVQWRIGFDWTGEAQSEIGVLVGLPAKWHKHDERGQLSGLPKLFDELIQGGEDPLNAVRTVVCLLAGEQRAT
ncbi:hypothetical protein MYCTH_2307164 [Thermothelomyces thermophilus ATCC 42464]|uniref:Uncharacterized protein n=1 Tax=Thermothelomyces thermophilus (strain ATCC 42464 / BCRC 31852 / DSM 1799) TaxID=573729 RepID=G2QFB6_THET4|nr:uncharacterized protein MYCTH_2307164 [Thermothelomyces thermophilus ATCC 42464]AEO59145.1 hypothetical protein MYCTH_2307164 [Thermothelomyces thermophilus ATCC 42464]